MLKLFLSSHGHLASGLKSSLDILLGNSSNVYIFDAYVDEHSVQFKLDEFYRHVSEDDQVILMSDLYGGSVNHVMVTYLNHPNTTLITGVNLALVLELSIKQGTVSECEIEEIVENSRRMMKVVKFENDALVNDDFF